MTVTTHTLILAFILTFLVVPKLMANESAEDRYYQLSQSFRDEWHEATLRAIDDPKRVIEELEQRLALIPDEKIRQRLYAAIIIISIKIGFEQTTEALANIEEIEEQVRALPEPVYTAMLLREKAKAVANIGHYQQALKLINSSVAFYKNIDLPLELALAKQERGQIYFMLGDYEAALNNYFEAYEVFKAKEENTVLATTVSGIAQTFHLTGDGRKAIEYYKEALALIDVKEKKYYASIIYFNLARIHRSFDELGDARAYFQKALDISTELEDKIGQAYVYKELAGIARDFQSYEPAIRYYEKAYKIIENAQDLRMQVNTNIQLANTYSLDGQHSKAIDTLNLAFDQIKSLDAPEAMQELNLKASMIYERHGDLSNSLKYYKEYVESLKNSLRNERQKTINEMKVKFDSERKDAENAALQVKNELALSELKQQSLYRRSLFITITLVLMILIFISLAFWHQVRVRKRLKVLTLTDELTKAPNRRSIIAYASQTLEDAKKTNSTLLVAIIDLDNFKTINDTFGHAVGDNVLVEFYRRVSAALRQHDKIGRFGGEEWLLILPDASKEKLPEIFDRMRDALNEGRIEGLPADFKVTFSLGATGYEKGETLDTLIKSADDAVYKAKQRGRNRWEFED